MSPRALFLSVGDWSSALISLWNLSKHANATPNWWRSLTFPSWNPHIEGRIATGFSTALYEPSLSWRFTRRHRAFTALVIILMTLALVTRAMAAPVIHLHDAMEAVMPAAAALPTEAAQADCAHDMDSIGGETEIAPTATHSHGPDSPMTSHAKACDSSGACCGPLALSDAPGVVLTALPTPEPERLLMFAGIGPDSPHRPPSPLLA